MTIYTEDFFEGHQNSAFPSSQEIAPFLMDIFCPKSVVDFGCGTGWWLSAFKQLGVTNVQGLDGDYVQSEMLEISKDEFVASDLKKPIRVSPAYDLAISLEVAEHLPESRAKSFVSDLCDAAPIVFFSAAIPGQGGNGHINEQWPLYWAEKFEKNGFVCFDIVRKKNWNSKKVSWWYKQNSFIFVRRDIVAGIRKLNQFEATPVDNIQNVVHPDLYSQKLRYENPGLGRWIKMFGKAFKKSFRNRSSRR